MNCAQIGQTLLTLIEVNREALSESLPLVLKREYGCHRRDMMRYMQHFAKKEKFSYFLIN